MNANVQSIDLPVFDNAQAWYGADMQQRTDWLHTLDAAESDEIVGAVRRAIAGGVDLTRMTEADFELPLLTSRLAAIGDDIKHGRGFALLRGLDPSSLTIQEQAYAFCGIGAHLGEAVSQNAKGHVLGHVAALGMNYADPTTRAYQTSAELNYHTDVSDIVGLMCIRPARSGGLSRIVSSTTVWNEVVRRRPDLARELQKVYCLSRMGEARPGQKAYAKVPLFHTHGNRMIVFIVPSAIEKAQALDGVPSLTALQREALAFVNALADEEGIRLDMDFRPGDMQFLLNHATLHGRTAYEDWPDPAQRRHLLRLWLACADGPDLPGYMTEIQGTTASGRPDGIHLPGVELKANLHPD